MILADKIINQRRKNGWSQEELANKIGVSRQAVSKWESAQSVPDLNKILTLAELFGVTTDYLLRDSIDDIQYDGNDDILPVLSLKEAQRFLTLRLDASKRIAASIMFMIFSIIPLLLLSSAARDGLLALNVEAAGTIGLIAAAMIAALTVGILIATGAKSSEFDYMRKSPFNVEYGVKGLVEERRNAYRSTYSRMNLIGVLLNILAIVPIFAAGLMENLNMLSFSSVSIFSLMFVFAGIGVYFLVQGGIVWASFDRILEEGDYTRAKKKRAPTMGALAGVYWLLAVAIYLAWSFLSGNWGFTWVVWPVAGVLFAAVMIVADLFFKEKEKAKSIE